MSGNDSNDLLRIGTGKVIPDTFTDILQYEIYLPE